MWSWCACTLTAMTTSMDTVLSVASFCLHMCVSCALKNDAAARYTNPFALFQLKILYVFFFIFLLSGSLLLFALVSVLLLSLAATLRPLRLCCVHIKQTRLIVQENGIAFCTLFPFFFHIYFVRLKSFTIYKIFVGFSRELVKSEAMLCCAVAKMLCHSEHHQQRQQGLHAHSTQHTTQQVRTIGFMMDKL